MGKDLDIGRATYRNTIICHDLSVVDLVICSSLILSIVKKFKVFEFDPFLNMYIAQYH